MDLSDIYEFCHGMPKIELHCHLYGTIRKSTMEALNCRAGNPLEQKIIEEFYTRGEKPKGVLRIFRTLDELLIREEEDLYHVTYQYLEEAHSHNVKYSEFSWNPTGTILHSHMTYENAQNGITLAITDALQDFGIQGKVIIAIDRERSPEDAIDAIQRMIKHKNSEVIGIGIDYREELGPPKKFEKAYSLARSNGYSSTAHAGEFGCPPENIWLVIDDLKVQRVDHGYTIIEDDELVDKCVSKGVVFCVVPTNSYYLRTLPPDEWATKHPIRDMIKKNIKVFPNTDDPAFHQVTPTKAWMMMIEYFDCTIDDMKSFMHNSIDASWVSEATKSEWHSNWSKYFDQFFITQNSSGVL